MRLDYFGDLGVDRRIILKLILIEIEYADVE
jgi:hypothetical protein